MYLFSIIELKWVSSQEMDIGIFFYQAPQRKELDGSYWWQRTYF